jgi:type I restriction enzyme M protein
MALKKSQLYSSLWKSCDELRGGMDASQYKDYVLTLLFLKYVSDRADRTLLAIPSGTSFSDISKLKNDKEIGDKLNKIVGQVADANDLRGVIDIADFNDENRLGRGNDMVARLTKLVAIFEDLNLGANTAGGDDLLGDAYEYLMRHFATESGKSKGQFYTPSEVSTILARVVGIGPTTTREQTVYDPTCGSGSLLLKAAHEAPSGMSVYGQEMDNATYALARMNMILHGYETAELWRDNTLSSPYFKNSDGTLRAFDFAVANPPFSMKAWTTGFDPVNDKLGRFDGFGVPPEKNGDYAFLLHIVKSLKSTGKAAVILPHGVLFRGHREADIRRELVKRRLIQGIIGLPANLFYGTGIPACVVVVAKDGAVDRRGIFMVDARRGFIKDGNKNRLRAQDIHKIVDVFTSQIELPRYSRLVPFEEVASEANDYNLNLPRYVDSAEPEDTQDIDGHLRGGIPERDLDMLEAYWTVLPSLRSELFETAGRPGYARLTHPLNEVERVILEQAEFSGFEQEVTSILEGWRNTATPLLTAFGKDADPKLLIATIAEDLLGAFRDTPLLDAYDVYQHLMSYWAETMQDDAYLVAAEGWVQSSQPREVLQVKDKNNKLVWPEPHDYLKGQRRFKSDLVPAAVLVDRYFRSERHAIEAFDNHVATLDQKLDEMLEEHSGEDGALIEVIEGEGDNQKITATAVRARLKEIGSDPVYADERAALAIYSGLLKDRSDTRAKRKAAQGDLDQKIDAKYPLLSEEEVKSLVVSDKWLAHMSNTVQGEVDRVSRNLTGRIDQLAERYATPLPKLMDDVEAISARVQEHLKNMGASWT